MAKKYYWLKLKNDFFTNKKIKKLRKIAGGDTYTIIYLKMQLLSIKNEGKLYFENVEDSFAEELSLELDESVDNVKVTLMFLIKNGLLIEVNEEEFILPETIECIGSETAAAERVRRHREKTKALQCNTLTLQSNTDVTKSNIEIEKEKEIEKDIDKKKDIKKKTTKTFSKPSVEEIKQYCIERKNNIDPEQFFDFYEAKGWKVGKNSMKDWKACVRTWERSRDNNSNKTVKSSNGIDWAEWDKKHATNSNTTKEDIQKMIDEGEIF